MSPSNGSGASSAMQSAEAASAGLQVGPESGDAEFAQHRQEVRIDDRQAEPSYHDTAGGGRASDAPDAVSREHSVYDALGLEGTRSAQFPGGLAMPLQALTPVQSVKRSSSPQTSVWSSMERGRLPESGRVLRGREPSSDEQRSYDRLTSMMESMLVRMERLEDDRTSRRSGSISLQSRPGREPPHAAHWGGLGVGFQGLSLESDSSMGSRRAQRPAALPMQSPESFAGPRGPLLPGSGNAPMQCPTQGSLNQDPGQVHGVDPRLLGGLVPGLGPTSARGQMQIPLSHGPGQGSGSGFAGVDVGPGVGLPHVGSASVQFPVQTMQDPGRGEVQVSLESERQALHASISHVQATPGFGSVQDRSLPVAQVRRAEQFFIGEPGERGSSDVSMPQCIPDEPSTPKTPIKPRIVRYDCTPGGTEIRPPACTPPVTPPPGRNTTPGGTSIPPGAPPVDRIDQSSFQDASAPPIPEYLWPGAVPMSIPPSMFPAFMPNWSSVQGVPGIWPYGPLPVPPPPPPPTEVPQPGVRSEEPSRYVQSLPRLEDYSPEQGAVILGDWIVTITPIVGSLTASATGWFEGIMQQVQEFYTQWLCSDPVTRLTIRQQAIEAGSVTAAESRCALLSQRVTNLLLESVPQSVKSEVVTVRALTPVGILFLLHTRYQPAGQAEKASILQYLVNPEVPKDVGAAVKGLRRWIRWLARASELQLSNPDATLLVKAVDKLASSHLSDTSAVFRVQAFRLQHGIEHQPTQPLVVSLAQLYLAELETLQLSAPADKKARIANLANEREGGQGSGEAGSPAGKGNGKKGEGKAGKGQGDKPKKTGETKEACRQFASEQGCPRGSNCPYAHDRSQGMKGRCFNCGGQSHSKAQCTSPGGGTSGSPTAKAQAQPSPKAAVRKTEAEAESAKAASPAGVTPAPGLGPSTAQVIQEAAASITNSLRSLKALRRASLQQVPDKGLIDGGATACLRQARSELEWEGAYPVRMRLAVGDSDGIRQTSTGILITREPVEPIVALHELVKLGYRMSYLRPGHIQVWKPPHAPLPLDQSSGCPEVTGQLAMDLINQVEQAHLRHARRVAALAQPIAVSFPEAVSSVWDSGDDLLRWFLGMVPSVPARLLPDLAVPATTRGPWPRRMRRRWARSEHVIVHLFSGASKGKFKHLPWPVIDVDVEEDLHNPETFGFLLGLAAQGRVAGLIGGPPCKTYSASRHHDAGSDGPRPLRGTGEDAYGLPGLSQCEQAYVDQDTLLYLKHLYLATVGRHGRQRLDLSWCSVLESPEDLMTVFDSPADGQGRLYPSWWRTPAWLEYARAEPVTMLSLDQGPLGHERRKPTTLAIQGVGWSLQSTRGLGHGLSVHSRPGQGLIGQTSGWAEWAPGLVQAIYDFLQHQVSLNCTAGTRHRPVYPVRPRSRSRSSSDSEGDSGWGPGVRVARATFSERAAQSWDQHVRQDHLPRRRDCYHCLQGELQSKAHRSVPVPQAYSLSVDLVGPMTPGQDEYHPQVRYGLVGVYAFPAFFSAPAASDQPAHPSDHAEVPSSGLSGVPPASLPPPGLERPNPGTAPDASHEPSSGLSGVPSTSLPSPGLERPKPGTAPDAHHEHQPFLSSSAGCVGTPPPPVFVPSDAGFAEGLSVPPEELEYFDDYSPSIAPDDAEDIRSVSLKPLSVSVFEGPDGFDWVDPSGPLHVADEGGASSDLPVFEDSGPAPQDPPVPLSSSEAQAVDDNTRCWENSWRDRPLPAVPIVELPFFVPLPTKHATAATQGVMHVVSSLRALGLPVVRLHSDRGGEFVNRTLRLFCDQHCIERTTTAGDNALDFRQNGRCENLVRRLKRQARTLLHAHGAPLDHWAFAMRHAAARLRAHALSVIGLTPPALLPWYTQVVIRTRTWHTDQWSSRATPGRVVSPSGDLHRGHLVLTADGQFLHSDSLVEGVCQGPHPEHHVAEHLLPPLRRHSGKGPPDASVAAPPAPRQGGVGEISLPGSGEGQGSGPGEDVEISKAPELHPLVSVAEAEASRPVSRRRYASKGPPVGILRCSDLGVGSVETRDQKRVRFDVPEGSGPGESDLGVQQAWSVDQSEAEAKRLLTQEGALRRDQVLHLLDASALRSSQSTRSSKMSRVGLADGAGKDLFLVLGCYGYGGMCGITRASYDRPAFTKVMCRFLTEQCPEAQFSAIALCRNRRQACHRDICNLRGSLNTIVPITSFRGGGLWVEGPDDLGGSSDRRVPGSQVLKSGSTHSVFPCLRFDPRRYHEVQDFQGDRLVAIGYTPSGTSCLNDDELCWLREHGFRLSDVTEPSIDPELRGLKGEPSLVGVGFPEPGSREEGVQSELVHCSSPVRSWGEDQRVVRTIDAIQANLKSFTWELKHTWDVLNPLGLGSELACVLRHAEREIEGFEGLLGHARKDAPYRDFEPVEASLKVLGSIRLATDVTEEGHVVECSSQDPGQSSSVFVRGITQEESGKDSEAGSPEIPLQTRTVDLAEVLREVAFWIPSWREEYESLVSIHKAVRPIEASILDEWRSAGRKFQIIPSKLVHTIKARSARRKARAVCCGNFETGIHFGKGETYAGGICATSLRAILRCCAAWGWKISSFDVKTAFLQSKLIDAHDVPTIVKTPTLWRIHHICSERFWLVTGALYGLTIAPRSWCEGRDNTMSTAKTCLLDCDVAFARFECDPNVWRVIATTADGSATTVGVVVWYVDDALIAAEPSFIRPLTEFVCSLWKTTAPEYLDEVGLLSYWGFELERRGEAILLHQKSYTTELLLRYPGQEKSDLPIVPRPGEVDAQPEEANPALVRECQQLAGELLWLMTYTRPDICFAVSAMTRLLSSRPKEAKAIGHQILRYIRKYPGTGLSYGPPPGDEGPEGVYVRRVLEVAEGISDASFAPQGGRSHHCSMTLLGGALITWSSQRQAAFMTQSTAECELVGLAHVLSDLEAQKPLFEALLETSVQCVLYCDNKATISICSVPFGAWRSRHLHVRANVVKEKLSAGWLLRHLPGRYMLADIGTKALQRARLFELLAYLDLHLPEYPMTPSDGVDEACAESTADSHTVRVSRHQEILKALLLLEVLDRLLPVQGSKTSEPTGELQNGWWPDWTTILVGCCVVVVSWLWLRGCSWSRWAVNFREAPSPPARAAMTNSNNVRAAMTGSQTVQEGAVTRVLSAERQSRLSVLSVLDLTRVRLLLEELCTVAAGDLQWQCLGRAFLHLRRTGQREAVLVPSRVVLEAEPLHPDRRSAPNSSASRSVPARTPQLLDPWEDYEATFDFRQTQGRQPFETEIARWQRTHWPQLANNEAPEVSVGPVQRDPDTEADSHTSFDYQVASAADFLVHHGYVFDWEHQLDEVQQRLFHSIADDRLRALREER